METLAITVNGQPMEVAPGVTLLEALRRHGIELPTLCHDERLTPYGGCRLCVVLRRDGRPGLVPACSTPVVPGMTIDTEAPEIREARRRQLQLILLNHRMECPVCERNGNCRLQDLVYEYGADENLLPFTPVRRPRDETSPLIIRDPEKCILCAKCVRLCDEVQGVAAIAVVGRGLEARVGTWLDGPLDCEFCGQCVDACPVGALVARPFVSEIPAWHRTTTTTTCSFCSSGCELTVSSDGARLLDVSGTPESEPNHGKLCVKGRFGWDVLHHADRLTGPLVRRDGCLTEATWDEALAAVAAGFAAAREHGAAIAAVGSTRLTTEDAYLLQRFVREGLVSPHVSAGMDAGVQALVAGMAETLGTARSTATLTDLGRADAVLVLRADPGRTHPLVKTEMVAAARRRASKLLLVHPSPSSLANLATQHLDVSAGGEEVLLLGLMHELLRRGAVAGATMANAEGYTAWRDRLQPYAGAPVSGLAGIQPGDLALLADHLRAARSLVVVVVTGRGIVGDEAAVTRRSVELLGLLGLLERPGCGVLVLGEKANTQGVVLAGLDPRLSAGGVPRAPVAAPGSVVGAGWSASETIRGAAAGSVGALYLVGQDPMGTWPLGVGAREALAKTPFIVVQDPFLTDSGRAADVVLPVRCLLEREGSLIGSDGVRRFLRPAVPPPTTLPGDGQLIREVARRMGLALPTEHELETELTLALDAKPGAGRLRLSPPRGPQAPPAPGGVFLDLAPHLFHSGSVTLRSETLCSMLAPETIRLAPADAQRLHIERGDTVRVSAGGREALLRAEIDPRLRRGTAAALLGGNGDGAARLVLQPARQLVVEIGRCT
jgi:NADH-quinone oxidoreductase subunit G